MMDAFQRAVPIPQFDMSWTVKMRLMTIMGTNRVTPSKALYCARGQAGNLINHAQLSSNRASCRSPLANQMRF